MTGQEKSTLLTRIRSEQDLKQGLAGLVELDPGLARVISTLPEVPLRLRNPGFEGLADIIVAQMVSRASATAIFGRLKEMVVPFEPATYLAAGEPIWVAAGLSRAKQTTLERLAEALERGELDLQGLCARPVQEAMDALTELKGIGPWTAEVFLLFCAGHADIFPAGDIALQHALGDILELPERPDASAARTLAQRWAPLRGVASRVLYAHYAALRGRSAVPV